MKVNLRKLWSDLNSWLDEKSSVLGAWSSLLQILVFPFVIITLSLGYFQLSEFLAKPDLHIEFLTPESLTYTVENRSQTKAEKPRHWFGIYDLDSKHMDIVPIPAEGTNYLLGNTGQGPNGLMWRHGKIDHRYFGFAIVTCENCESERRYWVYFVHGSKVGAWFVELRKGELQILKPIALMNDPEKYLKELCPPQKRIEIQ